MPAFREAAADAMLRAFLISPADKISGIFLLLP
jgi:hypothetical protein